MIDGRLKPPPSPFYKGVVGRISSANRCVWRAVRVGAEAGRLLGPGFSGKVLAVLSKTIYLAGQNGEIFWIAGEGSPLHRRCILAFFSLHAVHAGHSFVMDGQSLQVGESLRVDMGQAVEWRPAFVWPGDSAPLPRVVADVRRLLGIFKLLEIPDRIGESISSISALVEGWKIPSYPVDSMMGRVKDSFLDLAQACLNQDLKQACLKGRKIVGLGSGLTPSGDDFLGGLFFAARALHQTYPEDLLWTEDPVSELLDWARTRTHPISYTLLRDLVHGHGPEPLHNLVGGLVRGMDFDSVMDAAFRLTAIGCSSGWDILTGFLTGMLLVRGRLKAEGRSYWSDSIQTYQ